MRRWLVLLFVVLLPLQFAWSAASAYCQHEAGTQESRHVGHHFHAHKSISAEAKKSSASKLMADSDCATCHASGTSAIAAMPSVHDFASKPAAAVPGAARRYASALARAPDRPQWLRLV